MVPAVVPQGLPQLCSGFVPGAHAEELLRRQLGPGWFPELRRGCPGANPSAEDGASLSTSLVKHLLTWGLLF